MSKAYRARNSGGGGASADIGKDRELDPLALMQGQMGNDFLRAILHEANGQVNGEGLVSPDPISQMAEDPGKYMFPEDGEERRQQQDALPALREKHASNTYEDFEKGTPFIQGAGDSHAVSPNDVKQGALGDCYMMAGMISVARADPSLIEKLIKDNGDGTYDVTLYIRSSSYGRPKPVVKTVDARLAAKRAGVPLYAGIGDEADGQQELWVALLEKTLAQHKGSYELISGGNIAKGFQFHGATELLTGKAENYYRTDSLEEDDLLLMSAIALEDNKPISMDSRDMSEDAAMSAEAEKMNVYGNHAYPIEDVNLDARNMDLQNPWGSHHVNDISVEDVKRFYRSIRIGS